MEERYPPCAVLIPAAGSGRRMQAGLNKVLLPIHGVPLISWTLRVFLKHITESPVILLIAAQDRPLFEELPEVKSGRVQLVEGGKERKDSVYCGLQFLEQEGWPLSASVLIHDAARCMISDELVTRVLKATQTEVAMTTALPVVDTLLRVDDSGHHLVSREGMFAIQTPQAFRFELLLQAHQDWNGAATDDASMVRPIHQVAVIPGCSKNIKVTRPEDLAFAKLCLGPSST